LAEDASALGWAEYSEVSFELATVDSRMLFRSLTRSLARWVVGRRIFAGTVLGARARLGLGVGVSDDAK
jgi:hypothetical protein